MLIGIGLPSSPIAATTAPCGVLMTDRRDAFASASSALSWFWICASFCARSVVACR
jgi:hypothetical protein